MLSKYKRPSNRPHSENTHQRVHPQQRVLGARQEDKTFRRSATMKSEGLETGQKYFGYAAVIVPTLFTSVAVVQAFYQPVSWLAISLCAIFYVLTTLGINVGYHRLFSHAAFKAHPRLEAALIILGSMAAQGHMTHWVCNHRRHHQYTDQADDPHSPHLSSSGDALSGLSGFFRAHIGWLFEGSFPNVLYAKDLLKRPLLMKVNRLYLLWVVLGISIPAALGGLISSTWLGVWQGLLWGGFVRMFLVHHAIWSINSINHLYGARPFETGEKSTNNFWVAVVNLGDGWHNNHHAFPHSALHGLEWWQIDVSGWVIRALESVSLAWDIKRPTSKSMKAREAQV